MLTGGVPDPKLALQERYLGIKCHFLCDNSISPWLSDPDGWGIGGALFTAPSGTSGGAFFISPSGNKETQLVLPSAQLMVLHKIEELI